MKQITKIKGLYLLGFLMFMVLYSCEEHVIDDTLEVVEVTCSPDTSFKKDIEPIINANCMNCHNGSQPPNLTSYTNISNNATLIKSVVETRRMPLTGSLSVEEINLISCWVDNGAQNN